MTQGLWAMARLRWNAGVLEQGFSQPWSNEPQEWREVPDVLPRLDEVASVSADAISRPDVAAALATGEAPRVRLDGGREAAAAADMAIARAAPVAATFGATEGIRFALMLQPDGRVSWYKPDARGPRGFISDFGSAEHVIEIEPSAILKSRNAETTSPGKTIEDRVAAIERRHLPLIRIDGATGAAKIVGVSRADGTGPVYEIERAALSRMPDMLRDNGKADLPSEATPEEITHGGLASDPVTTLPAYRGASWDARRGGAFYEFAITSATPINPARLRSVSPIQLEGRPGFWHEVLYDRKPEPLRDTDRLTYETVAEILRSFSSPTMGAPGSVHDGQQGFIVYETDGLPFVVSRLAELATLDDGRTAKDMLCEQGREIERLETLADYQREELTRLEDTARLGLRDDPAAGATLAAVTKERDELRAAHDNARAALAVSEREAAKLQTAIDAATAGNADIARDRDAALFANNKWKEEVAALRDEIEETRGKRNEWQRRALAAEQRRAETLARIRKAIEE